MDYIEKTLGIKIRRSNWEHETKIPLFLKNEYSLQKLLIDQIVCMSITPYDELPPIGTLKKHINQLQNLSSCPVVLELNGISRQRRGTLIDERIPFVVTDKQLYLPFLGVHLTEQFTPDKKNITGETLLPSAQMLLFYFILGKNRPLPLQDATKRLGFSAMTISRAAAQLVELGFLEKKATGVQKTLSSAYTRSEGKKDRIYKKRSYRTRNVSSGTICSRRNQHDQSACYTNIRICRTIGLAGL